MHRLINVVFLYLVIYALPAFSQPARYTQKTDSTTDSAQKDKETNYPCDENSCAVIDDTVAAHPNRSSKSYEKLEFSLPDTFGRQVNAQDYQGMPLLLEFGAAWCGSCQQEACFIRELAAKYVPRGLGVIRVMCGDNELSALEFQKHYRLPIVHLLDVDDSVDRKYNDKGRWSFLMLVDRNGRVVYRGRKFVEDDMAEIGPVLEKLLAGQPKVETVVADEIPYMPATLARSDESKSEKRLDRFPSVACGRDGKIYVVFTTCRNGSGDIFIRVFDGKNWSEDRPVAATEADEYDGAVVVDRQNRVWVSWTSNAGAENYNVFVTSLANLSDAVKPMRLTDAYDDAMHARIACDNKGRLWLTYYKWLKKGGQTGKISRDKEIYLRRWEHGKWSDEIQISPTDVPWYEDHTDPTITASGSEAIVCWSWDFHQASGTYSTEAAGPTIFSRQIGSDLRLGKIIGISGKQTDLTPAIAVGRGKRIWYAWDSFYRRKKTLCVKNLTLNGWHTGSVWKLSEPVMNVCTPAFAVDSNGTVTLLWSQTSDGSQWLLKRSDFDPQQQRWSIAETIRSKGGPRQCSAVYDNDGTLWISYSAQTDKGREIIVERLEGETHPDQNEVEPPDTARQASETNEKNGIIKWIGNGLVLRSEPKDIGSPKMTLSKAEYLENFDILAETIDKNYSFFDHKGIDWQKIVADYRPKIENARTAGEFYHLIHRFVMELKDFHSWLCNYKDVPSLGRFSPPVSVRLIEEKAVVSEVSEGSEAWQKGLRKGSVIISVDGSDVKTKIKNIRPLLHLYSSERCFLEQAYRRILDGEKNTSLTVKFVPPSEKSPKIAVLKRTVQNKHEIIKLDFPVEKGKFIWYGIHPSGCGYIRILSFEGRMEIADEFDNALQILKDTPGLIIDVRENPGGHGTAQARIIGRFITSPTKVDIIYKRNGPAHQDFAVRDTYFEPTGNWQYTKPVALLINAVTGSACDLFACRIISTRRPITIGSTTHGNLTGECVYVLLPCNLVVRISKGYVCNAEGGIIEGNGNVPQIQVIPSITDIVNMTDPVIERAVKELQQQNQLKKIDTP